VLCDSIILIVLGIVLIVLGSASIGYSFIEELVSEQIAALA
jgi:hypothetical protein